MGKTSEKVAKDPRSVKQGKKPYETHMKRVKEKILKEEEEDEGKILKEKEDNQLPTPSTSSISSSTCDPTSSTSSSTCDPTSSNTKISNGAYVYGVGMLAILAMSVCVFFAYPKNKKQVNKKQDQPPKRRHMLQKNI